MAPGILTKNFLRRKRIMSPVPKVSTLMRSELPICVRIVRKLRYTLSPKSNPDSQRPLGSCPTNIQIPTAKRNHWSPAAGINVIYLVNLSKYTQTIANPLKIAMSGRYCGPYAILADNKIHVNAPAGPKTLYPLDANIAAINDDQIAVMSPCTGVAPLAIAREIESGMVTIATTNPDFRFDFRLERMYLKLRFIFLYKEKNKQVFPIDFWE